MGKNESAYNIFWSRGYSEEAVLRMLEEQGVLSGINLNKVAKAAGVNRSLVYHHFGSFRGLLRSAIKRELLRRHLKTMTLPESMFLGARG